MFNSRGDIFLNIHYQGCIFEYSIPGVSSWILNTRGVIMNIKYQGCDHKFIKYHGFTQNFFHIFLPFTILNFVPSCSIIPSSSPSISSSTSSSSLKSVLFLVLKVVRINQKIKKIKGVFAYLSWSCSFQKKHEYCVHQGVQCTYSLQDRCFHQQAISRTT